VTVEEARPTVWAIFGDDYCFTTIRLSRREKRPHNNCAAGLSS
jgi:hypothetical protein